MNGYPECRAKDKFEEASIPAAEASHRHLSSPPRSLAGFDKGLADAPRQGVGEEPAWWLAWDHQAPAQALSGWTRRRGRAKKIMTARD
jgi:hypothetical protein